jgi:hypothetical protein
MEYNTTTKHTEVKMENKQTAVEWLVNYFKNLEKYPYKTIQELEEKAKAMEKEQIIDAFGVGCQVESARLIGYHEMSEQYYNETYKGGEQ